MKKVHKSRSAHFKRMNSFEAMTEKELREFIDGCHETRSYDAVFDKACFVFNNRFR